MKALVAKAYKEELKYRIESVRKSRRTHSVEDGRRGGTDGSKSSSGEK